MFAWGFKVFANCKAFCNVIVLFTCISELWVLLNFIVVMSDSLFNHNISTIYKYIGMLLDGFWYDQFLKVIFLINIIFLYNMNGNHYKAIKIQM